MSFSSDSFNRSLSVQLQTHLDDRARPHFCNTVTYIRLTTVLLLRAGYVLIQIGTIPISDVYSLVLHNILDITVSICSYGLIGYLFSNGPESLGGFMGASSTLSTAYPNLDSLIHGFAACLIGSAIITTMLAGRIQPMSATMVSLLHAGLIQPMVMHWVWHDKGWMFRRKILNTKFAVKDHGGALTVHLASGVGSLWGTVCLGRRLVKLKEMSASSLGTASPGLTFIGYIFVFLGLSSFTLPTQNYEKQRIPADFIGITITNSIMALSSGLMIIILQCFCFGKVSGYWVLLKCLQGCVAGLVTMSAGMDIYDHLVAFFVASAGTTIFYCITMVLERMFYEDYCNIVPIHLVCGLVGAIFPAMFGNSENLGTSIPFVFRLYHTGWQVVCSLVVIIWSTAFYLPLFVLLNTMGLLANRSEELNHQRSLNVMRNVDSGKRFWRIFTYSEFAPFVDPGSQSRTDKALDFLKESNDSRREFLKAAMSRKIVKQPTMMTSPVIPADEIVKDMGILEAERYPASFDDDLDTRLTSNKHFYETVAKPLDQKSQAEVSHRNASGDYPEPEKIVHAEIHNVSIVNENKGFEGRKKISPRRRPHTVRRKKRVKRLDSDFSIGKSKRK